MSPSSPRWSQWQLFVAVSMTMVGCCSNVFATELLVSISRKQTGTCGGGGPLLTLCQFAFMTAMQAPTHAWKSRNIPLKHHAIMVAIFFTMSVLTNKVYHMPVSMPLHQIFRSAGLMATFVVTKVFLGRVYSRPQTVAVMLVTLGVIVTTLADGRQSVLTLETLGPTDGGFMLWAVGVALLLVVLLMTAALGVVQERLYNRTAIALTIAEQQKKTKNSDSDSDASVMKSNAFRRHRDIVGAEGMFYIHLLSLPLFLAFWPSLMETTGQWNACIASAHRDTLAWMPESWSLAIARFVDTVGVPLPWAYASVSVLTQSLCIAGIYRLHSLTSALTATFVTSVRKFVSIGLSIAVFQSEFTRQHALGCALVIIGSAFYVIPSKSLTSSACNDASKVKRN